jgi:tRNA (cmo5U34)-methyltransferase
MQKDELFKEYQRNIARFEFNQKVAGVFDDMVSRSVPFYKEVLLQTVSLASALWQKNTSIYDLGCSTGNFCQPLLNTISDSSLRLIGVDTSLAMLEQLASKINEDPRFQTVQQDIRDVKIINASVIVMNYTLQFIAPADRQSLINQLYAGLVPGGALILSEKIHASSERTEELFVKHYYALKERNGYSELEISQKREALEKVLIPETGLEHRSRLLEAGFRSAECWHQWYNFASMIAIK